MMKPPFALVIVLATLASRTWATNPLFTDDVDTVPPGVVQFQQYLDTGFAGSYRLAGSFFTFGGTDNLDGRLSYAYLWRREGRPTQIGPNLGVKWRFAGTGRRGTSAGLMAVYAINQSIGEDPEKNDFGGMLIVTHTDRFASFLANFGRVFVGERSFSDLWYYSFAVVRRVSPEFQAALEYSDIDEIGQEIIGNALVELDLAVLYNTSPSTIYSLQMGYSPNNPNTHWRLTLGMSMYL